MKMNESQTYYTKCPCGEWRLMKVSLLAVGLVSKWSDPDHICKTSK